jgi:hypothetical protein
MMLRRKTGSAPQANGLRHDGAARRPTVVPEPERLVGLGFRYWMLGRQSGEIGHWERAWGLYCGVFGLCGARLAIGSLSGWVNMLCMTSLRAIEVSCVDRPEFCRDECIAVSMIAACQHDTCPALRACAFALIKSSSIDRVVGEAREFAVTLDGLEQRLSRESIISIAASLPAANRLPS